MQFIILVFAFQVLFSSQLSAKEAPVIPFKLQQENSEESLSRHDLRDAVEERLFEMTNQWRQSKKLKKMEESSLLQKVARDYSIDMLRKNYFSHYSPEGKMVLDRIQKAKPGYDADCAENLHQIYSPQGLKDPKAIADQMLDDWLHSASHRKNLSAKNYDFMSVGCSATSTKIYCTQLFSAQGI